MGTENRTEYLFVPKELPSFKNMERVKEVFGLPPRCAHWAVHVTPKQLEARGRSHHAKNKIAGRFIPFLVPYFWDKNTGICAGAMPHRRDFPATTGI